MNAATEIQAAIDKLTRLRDGSTPGPWDSEDGWRPPQWDQHTYARIVAGQPNPISGIRHNVVSTNGSAPGSAAKRRDLADAALVVTLHATIDAQLEVLRLGLRYAAFDRSALIFARAINGEVSDAAS